MGLLFSSLYDLVRGRAKEYKILILGLDNAGKTTLLGQLVAAGGLPAGVTGAAGVTTGAAAGTRRYMPEQTTPTIGFNMEVVRYPVGNGAVTFQAWDLGGQCSIRPYWRCYYGQSTAAVVYVVDSSDRERLGVAQTELVKMLAEQELAGAVLAVLANKQDVPGCLTVAELSRGLGLPALTSHTHRVFKTCTRTNTGVPDVMHWLADTLTHNS